MLKFALGDHVFVYKQAGKSCKWYKFARPYHGPYWIIRLYDGGADVTVVDHPKEPSIRVPFERLRVCPEEVPDVSWLPRTKNSVSSKTFSRSGIPLTTVKATSTFPATRSV